MTEKKGPNVLYYGDNLDILRHHFADKSIDLVYLDPPFKSDQSYNVLFAERDGSQSAAQIRVFEDTWHWDKAAAEAFQFIVEQGGKASEAMQAFQSFLGQNDMLAYLAMMSLRLTELHRVLKPTGSIYLHCDPTASHYLKVLLDATFGPDQFRNEIVWRRTGSHNSSRRFGPIHDVILFYSKTNDYFFKVTYGPYLKGHVEGYFKKEGAEGKYWTNALTGSGIRSGESGNQWQSYNPTAKGRHWAIPGRIIRDLGIDESLSVQEKLDALDEAGFICHPPSGSDAMPTYVQYLKDSPGMPSQDIWAYQPHTRGTLHGVDEGIDEDVRWLRKQGDPERLGYPTQKPKGLLKRIICSSCPSTGVVLDPFCGCGTTIAAAQELRRRWIGIDITHLAISLIKHRLSDVYGPDVAYQVIGEPADVAGARALAEQDRFQFQWWALSLVNARAVNQKKGADRGIDGRLYFHDEAKATRTKHIVFSVKSGRVSVKDVRDLRGVVERERAAIGVLITLEPPTRPMHKEAVTAGFYRSPGWNRDYQKLQILTVAELFEGKVVDYPPHRQVNVTFRKAPRAKDREDKPEKLPF